MNIEQRLEQALADFDKANNDIIHLLESRNKELLWKPEPKKWSPAQSIEHILVSNELYFPILEKKIAQGGDKKNNLKPYQPTFWGKMLYKAVDPSLMATKKSVTPKIFNPQPSVEIPTLIQRFERDQKKLKLLMQRTFTTDASQKIRSPLTPLIRYSIVDVMAILSKHEMRHYLQAINVLKHRK